MSSELVHRDVDSWVDILGPVGTLAANIANTEFVPKSLRGKSPAVAACILTGRELGIGPMESLQKIDVIEGRPSISAELMRSMIQRAGHELAFEHHANDKVTLAGRRKNSEVWTRVTWTMADAQRAGVAGKDVWKKYPRTMLASRCTSELARLMFADVLSGVTYTPDEIQDEISSAPVTIVRDAEPAKLQRKPKAVTASVAVVEPAFDEEAVVIDIETGEIIDDGEIADPQASAEQIADLTETLRVNGYLTRADMLTYVQTITERDDLKSANDLTTGQVLTVLASLGVQS